MRPRLCAIPALALAVACSGASGATDRSQPPIQIRERLAASLSAARGFERSPWRDVPPLNGDETLNGYVEIPRGESTKWEFRIPLNRLEVDRMIPAELGGYPTNYGFIPRTISYDGDPTDVLVLGPPVHNGAIVKGRIVALMQMMDTGDLDSKVVITPLDERGAPQYALEQADRDRLTHFFDTYKRHEGKVTQVTGWGTDADAQAFLRTTSGFFATGRAESRSALTRTWRCGESSRLPAG